MNHYLDIISRNHELEEFSESSTSPTKNKLHNKFMQGGRDDDIKNKKDLLKTKSSGCFPPIYKIKKEEIEKEKNMDKIRGFAQVKTALSIKDIMENRRPEESQSFITL